MQRWLHRRGIRDAEDAAADAIVLALQRFGASPESWREVFAWCSAVARNLAASAHRRLARLAFLANDQLALRVGLTEERDAPRMDVSVWLHELRARLAPADLATFDLLIAGIHDTAQIAALRGRCERAVRASRARISAAASDWNLARLLPPRAISPCAGVARVTPALPPFAGVRAC